MFMTKNRKEPGNLTPPKRAVIRHKNGTPMFQDPDDRLYEHPEGLFTIFPSKMEASRASNKMCQKHDSEFWKLHDVYAYEEE